jgi:hypothetical protein
VVLNKKERAKQPDWKKNGNMDKNERALKRQKANIPYKCALFEEDWLKSG